ncbi:MAG: helix-turn-helix transcriptional regulator [Lachnospiraceae bacterium]|nr:helix-turn-helix transcriptional regulator [Lachnospiraceae bacterium]
MRKYLKEARKKMGYTQAQTAKLIGVSQNYYCDIENGVRQKEIKASILLALSSVLKNSITLMDVIMIWTAWKRNCLGMKEVNDDRKGKGCLRAEVQESAYFWLA